MSGMATRGRIDYGMFGLAEALGARDYQVPIYQRSYAWTTTVVEEFLGDLVAALNNNEPDYFLGTLVLTPGDDDRMTVIDGQQRLATTTLVMAAIRNAYSERGKEKAADDIRGNYLATFDRTIEQDTPRLLLNEDDQLFFSKLVVDEQSPVPLKESHQRILDASEFIKEALASDLASWGNKDSDRLRAWWDYVEKRATVITVTVPTEADAFVIFEALNARGAKLTIGDMLKNLLFMRAGSKLNGVKSSWMAVLAALEITAENGLFVDFLRHHWISTHGEPVRERDLYRKIRDDIQSQAAAVAYVEDLADAGRFYAALLAEDNQYWSELGGTRKTVKANVETLIRLELEQNRPLLIAIMQHFSSIEARKALQAVVNWSVRGLIVGGIGGGRMERVYAEAALKVRQGKVKTAKQLRSEIAGSIPADDTFRREFSIARQTKPRVARYLLLALEQSARSEKDPELVPNADADEVNLEHILPRNPAKGTWKEFREDEQTQWAYRLGNQCLLRKSHNAKIGNEPWSVKQPILRKSALKVTKQASKASPWDKQAIDDQQEYMAKLAVKTWPR
jgi:hypothetical protein